MTKLLPIISCMLCYYRRQRYKSGRGYQAICINKDNSKTGRVIDETVAIPKWCKLEEFNE